MHDTMRDLADSLESGSPAGPATYGERYEGELAASLDLQEVAERTLEALQTIPGVQAASLESGELVATAGLSADEGVGTAVGLPENDNLRAIELGYRYRIDDDEGSATLIRSGVVVPLRTDSGSVGALSAFTRAAEHPFSEEDIDKIERLALRAGPAIANARQYSEARALADLDGLTGLHNRRYFHEALAHEAARAERYSRRLALIVIDLDDFKAINDRVGHLAGDAVLAEAAKRMLSVVRGADTACRVGGDEFAIILPEAGAEDGELLAGRIARAVSMEPIANAGKLLLSVGVAEMRQGDTPEHLFERADDALYRAKESGKARAVLANDV
jgi:diguanylate cyclase (GGDEF)-like protein